jgi:hypothetical protein
MELCMSGGHLQDAHRDFDAMQRAMWLRTAFNNATFSEDKRFLSPDVFIELCVILSAADVQPNVEVRRRTISYGAGGVINAGSAAVNFGRDPAHPGFLTLPHEITAHSWRGLQTHSYQVQMRGGLVPLSAFLSSDRVDPRGPMVDATYDASGLYPEVKVTKRFAFMNASAPARAPDDHDGAGE